jgi:hypothetical protein
MEDDNGTTTPGLHFEFDPNARGGVYFDDDDEEQRCAAVRQARSVLSEPFEVQ